MSLLPGTRLGPYEIFSPIGAGGMGKVYKAKDTRLGRDVAVKVLSEDLSENADALARFEREAKAVAALNHPNILGIFDFGRVDNTSYAVMELLEGESLRTRLDQGPLAFRTALELGRQMALGLAAAHDKGIIHRDLKPGNLWITKDGRLKILDFGLVKQVNPSASVSQSILLTQAVGQSQESQTKTGMILGTMGYMSPEQVRGEMVDARSDIFSFGAVLFEMFTGRRAFARDTASDTLAAILRDDFVDSEDTSRLVPAGLLNILRHCIEKNPDQRFQSAHDVAFALENFSPSLPSFAPFTAPFAPQNRRTSRKWAALVAGLLVCAGLLGWVLRGFNLPKPTFRQVTFRRGNVLRARFTPDGQNIVYSAAWDSKPSEIYMSRLDGSGVRAIGLPRADLMAVNARGELLILLKSSQWAGTSSSSGTLALASLDGGTPREVLGRVRGADFAPDGRALAAIYQDQDGGPHHLDYPLGTRLLSSVSGFLGAPRISPQGDRVAFVYSGAQTGRIGARGGIAVVDRAGKRRDLKVGWLVWDEFLVWSKDGREIYFATRSGLKAVDMDDHVREVNADATPPLIHDISPQGLMLLERELGTNSSTVRFGGQDLDMGWQNNSILTGFSRDGSLALLYETGGGESNQNRPFLRRFDHSPPKVLDPGFPLDLNPSGDSALILIPGDKPKLRMVPTGLGVPRELGLEGWDPTGGRFSMDGEHVYAFARQGTGPIRILKLPVDGSQGSVLSESIQNVKAFSPDGKHLLCVDGKGQPSITSDQGGTPKPLTWTLEPGEAIVAWNETDEALVTHPEDTIHLRLDRVEISTGRRTIWQRLVPPDPASTVRLFNVRVSRDGKTAGYTYTRVLVSDLLVAEGLK